MRPGWERTADLDWWARQIRHLSEGGIDVYAYANNHYQGHSPGTLRAMQQRLGLPVSEPRPASQQQQLNFLILDFGRPRLSLDWGLSATNRRGGRPNVVGCPRS